MSLGERIGGEVLRPLVPDADVLTGVYQDALKHLRWIATSSPPTSEVALRQATYGLGIDLYNMLLARGEFTEDMLSYRAQLDMNPIEREERQFWIASEAHSSSIRMGIDLITGETDIIEQEVCLPITCDIDEHNTWAISYDYSRDEKMRYRPLPYRPRNRRKSSFMSVTRLLLRTAVASLDEPPVTTVDNMLRGIAIED